MISFGHWQFDLSDPVLNLACMVLLVSLLLTIRAVFRRLYHRRPLRALLTMLFNVIAFAVLLVLLLEPQHRHLAEESVILLTEGAETAPGFPPPLSRLYLAPGAAASMESRRIPANASWLLDIAQLNFRETALSSIDVHGFGLDQDQWRQFASDIRIDFRPPPVYGFTEMQWQRSLLTGETLSIRGRYQQANHEGVIQLRLLDPAANTVSETRITNGENFKLAVRTRARGNLEYSIQAWVANELQSEQLVPIEVGSGQPLNIMIEQSAPSFETRQLKNHFASYGHRIRLNTAISKGKAISQTINLPERTETTLSPRTLAMQDVLIMGGRALSRLAPIQKQWLIDAVENGLGLLILADLVLLEEFHLLGADLLKGFELSPDAETEAMLVPRLLTGQAQDWQRALRVQPMKLAAGNADVLIDDGNGRGLVLRRSRGIGNIAVSLLSHSESWLTSGARAHWSDLWAVLIAGVARQPEGSLLLPPAHSDFNRVGQKTTLCALADEEGLRVSITALESEARQAGFELDLAADTHGSGRQCFYFWPQSGGWHQVDLLSGSDGSVQDRSAIYVFQSGQWRAQQRKKRVDASRARTQFKALTKTESPAKWVSGPIDIFWLWLILVLSATLLWLERKLDFG